MTSGLVWMGSVIVALLLFLLWRQQPGTVPMPWRLMQAALIAVVTVQSTHY